jgi:hypothetical protein
MVWPTGSPDLTTCASSLWDTVKDKISKLHLTVFEALQQLSGAALMTFSIHYGKKCPYKHGQTLKFVWRMQESMQITSN